ncbi:hypothetical protein [Paenibacillus sp. KN14-4R]|uniref:hypothetical protein n=1 Tax=Paenibacillus sp. KN14-4R TaxID=3445773 RepID=UPI003F9F114A
MSKQVKAISEKTVMEQFRCEVDTIDKAIKKELSESDRIEVEVTDMRSQIEDLRMTQAIDPSKLAQCEREIQSLKSKIDELCTTKQGCLERSEALIKARPRRLGALRNAAKEELDSIVDGKKTEIKSIQESLKDLRADYITRLRQMWEMRNDMRGTIEDFQELSRTIDNSFDALNYGQAYPEVKGMSSNYGGNADPYFPLLSECHAVLSNGTLPPWYLERQSKS